MRSVLALVFVVVASITPVSAHDSLPLCDAPPEPFPVTLIPPRFNSEGFAATCALRVLAYPAPANGIRFVHRRNGTVIEEVTVTAHGYQHVIRDERYTCDGTFVGTGEHDGPFEYNHAFVNAQVGDMIDVHDGATFVGQARITEFGCATLDWASTQCRVATCDDEHAGNDDTGGCSTSRNAGLFGLLVAAVFLARRRLCACRA